MTEIICTIITALAGIVVACLSIQISKVNKRSEEQNELQERQTLLLLRMVDSSISLSLVSANALMDYKNNGNVEEAYSAAHKAKQDYKALMQEITAHEVVK